MWRDAAPDGWKSVFCEIHLLMMISLALPHKLKNLSKSGGAQTEPGCVASPVCHMNQGGDGKEQQPGEWEPCVPSPPPYEWQGCDGSDIKSLHSKLRPHKWKITTNLRIELKSMTDRGFRWHIASVSLWDACWENEHVTRSKANKEKTFSLQKISDDQNYKSKFLGNHWWWWHFCLRKRGETFYDSVPTVCHAHESLRVTVMSASISRQEY